MRTDELGNTYNMMGEKLYKRFEIREDKEPICDLKYMIYDNDDMIVVSYITEEELSTGLEVVKYLNGLASEIKSYEKELASLREYIGLSKSELVTANRECEARRRYAEGLHRLDIKHAREVLATCIAQYPESQGLLDFKSTMEW